MTIIIKKIFIILFVLLCLEPSALANEWFEDSEGTETTLDTNEKISLNGNFLDHDILQVEVLANGLTTPVLGIAFHLTFDASKLSFLRYEPGDFLERGGDPFYLVQNSDGKIIFGETLRRDDKFPVGDGIVSKIYFQRIEDGDDGDAEYPLNFENGVVSTLDTVRQDLTNIKFENAVLEENSVNENVLKASVIDADNVYFKPWWITILYTLCALVSVSIIFILILKIKNKKKNLHFPKPTI